MVEAAPVVVDVTVSVIPEVYVEVAPLVESQSTAVAIPIVSANVASTIMASESETSGEAKQPIAWWQAGLLVAVTGLSLTTLTGDKRGRIGRIPSPPAG